MPKTIPTFVNIDASQPDDAAYAGLGSTLGDRRDGRVYVHDGRIRAAVRVALATGRPLLLRGEAGSGKSSLAPFIARLLRRRFYVFTVTARTQARDLLWSFDPVRRLSDAQVRAPGDTGPSRIDRIEHYIEPGVLWWAFEPASAVQRGAVTPAVPAIAAAKDPGIGPTGRGTVLLVDEIDKADPDVPNNLLEPLGSLQFTVQETGLRVSAAEPPLVFVTTNDERELSVAFQRRCVVLHLEPHTREDLMAIADVHFGQHDPPVTRMLSGSVADVLLELRREALTLGRRPPSTAEYLDAVRACLVLRVSPARGQEWADIRQLTLVKHEPSSRV